jgi:ABC-type multidrug transport system fused ATPase/permease subunit
VAFYDANKTGALVSRIMSDVEGVRNLLGTGWSISPVDRGRQHCTRVVAAHQRSTDADCRRLPQLLCVRAEPCVQDDPSDFRERGKINAEVTGRLTESLGGVRVVKGYHAEEREEKIFAVGVRRLLENVMRTLTATSLMGLSASVLLGVVGAATMYVGGRQMVAHTLTPGGYISYNLYLVFLVAPILQVVSIGTQITEALAGLERTQEIMRERPEDQDPRSAPCSFKTLSAQLSSRM